MSVNSVDQGDLPDNTYGDQAGEFAQATQNLSGDAELNPGHSRLTKGNPVENGSSVAGDNYTLTANQGASAVIEVDLHNLQQYIAQAGYDPVRALTQAREVGRLGNTGNNQYLTSEQQSNLTSSLANIRNNIYSDTSYRQIVRGLDNFRQFIRNGEGSYERTDAIEQDHSLFALIENATSITDAERMSARNELQTLSDAVSNSHLISDAAGSEGSNSGNDGSAGGSGGDTAVGVIGTAITAGLLFLGLESGG